MVQFMVEIAFSVAAVENLVLCFSETSTHVQNCTFQTCLLFSGLKIKSEYFKTEIDPKVCFALIQFNL